jgi:hypothetical protein
MDLRTHIGYPLNSCLSLACESVSVVSSAVSSVELGDGCERE